MPSPPALKLAIALSAGGARAAYQVGVLRYLAEHCPDFNPRIFTGVSAGSINAAFLAQGEPIKEGTIKLYQLWEELEFDQVMRTNFKTLLTMALRWLYDLFISKVTRKLLLKSLFDASPLAHTLLTHIHFWKISRAIQSSLVDALAISATNYHDGTTTIFYESSNPVAAWRREQRRAVPSLIRIRHIMASCSIPILFEPVRIGDHLYGDGSLRFNFPLSPSIRLGATHILAIGIRCSNPENPFIDHRPDGLSLGFVAGSVLNSIFMDSLEADYENLCRMNEVAVNTPAHHIPAYLIRPSRDLGALAKEYFDEIPFHLRQVLRTFSRPSEMGDLLSYLMFTKGYIMKLLELGMQDAAAELHKIQKALRTVPMDADEERVS